ncbi:uncharacterized protein DNG_08359 [Cephalotrichum gorgonifer]|uniref:Uncharacterized protein n=1 Tax=Cephalotrichum gorgonifer TaxID=2041049 RepID=A0AAE8SZ42_9PEZI|nr:uncharacterized protein DNG_08359 [Cephalotrichum gorgonifer]
MTDDVTDGGWVRRLRRRDFSRGEGGESE